MDRDGAYALASSWLLLDAESATGRVEFCSLSRRERFAELILSYSQQARPHLPDPLLEAVPQSELFNLYRLLKT